MKTDTPSKDLIVANPFAIEKKETTAMTRTTGSTDAQRAIAEVQAAMVVAKSNPRDPVVAVDRILNACTRPSLAESALYQYSKGGTEISGPSIRLAETLAQNWGNIQFGVQELDRTANDSLMMAYAWDIEANVRKELKFYVPLIRYTKKGSYKLEDPREIYEQNANQAARRLRSCILSVIPGDVTEIAIKQCEVTLSATADVSEDSIRKMLNAFEAFGVTKQMIEQRIQRRIDSIRPAQMVSMKKIYASLKDGMSSVSDWFAVETNDDQQQGAITEGTTKTDAIKSRIKGAASGNISNGKNTRKESSAETTTNESTEHHDPPPQAAAIANKPPKPAEPAKNNATVPISFQPEYKELMMLGADFTEAYNTARKNTGLKPDSIESCIALIKATKEAIDILNNSD